MIKSIKKIQHENPENERQKSSSNNKDKDENNSESNKYNEEEEEFIKLNKYYYYLEDKKIMKSSLNRANKSKKDNKIHSVSYNCFDTYCTGRASAQIKYKNVGGTETLYIESFTIKNNHSLNWENHVYVISQKVIEDIENNKSDKENLKNIGYSRAYFINIIKKNPF